MTRQRLFIVRICSHPDYGGLGGGTEGAPVSVDAGYANPVQFTTSEIGVSGGGSFHCQRRLPSWLRSALTQPEITIDNGQAVTTSLAVANFFSSVTTMC
ncbi:ash family protein [Escherichia coli]|nr:ash family protein [Escherichia coli]